MALCSTHYRRMERTGSLGGVGIREKTSRVTMVEDHAKVITSSGVEFLIDAEDAIKCSNHSWCVDGYGYANAHIHGKTVKLHRFVMNPPAGVEIDHINGNVSDNRKMNLREASRQENNRNRTRCHSSTGVLGVYQKSNSFQAMIGSSGQLVFLGTFKTLEKATEARRKAELECFGEFAPAHQEDTCRI